MQRVSNSIQILAPVTLFCIALLPGCGQKEPATAVPAPVKTAQPAPPATPAPAAPAPVTQAAPAPAPATTVSSAAAPAAAAPQAQVAKGIATADHQISGVEVTLLELKRTSGDTLTARWRYLNTNAESKALTKSSGWTDAYRLAWDSYVIDGTTKKKYMVLTDSKNYPIAGKHEGGDITIEAGKTLTTWAKYPAPPESVEKVSLFLPGVSPFEDVPISR